MTKENKKENKKDFKETNLKCIAPRCDGDLYRFETGKKLGFDIMYFKCQKCDDMTYYFYYGDTYDRELFTLDTYQGLLKSVDVEILSMRNRERELNERERSLIYREQKLENRGIRGLLGRIFKKNRNKNLY